MPSRRPSTGRLRADAQRRLRDPLWWTSFIQLMKTAVASVIAWVLASEVFSLPQGFLAPWAALLVVHTTVYRTFTQGLRQVTGAVLGVLLAYAVGNLVGLSAVAVAVLLVIGLAAGAIPWFRDERTAVAATGLIVLTTGFSTHDAVLLDRLFDTAIGIVIGLAVNLVVWPPLRDYAASCAIDEIDDEVGELLCDMAEGLRGSADQELVTVWVDRTRDLDHAIDHAWSLLRQSRESSRLNPRRAARGARTTEAFEDLLRHNEQAVAESRSMARTLGHSIDSVTEWEPLFRDRWVGLLREAGEAIGSPDSVRVQQVRSDLGDLSVDLGKEDLSARHWPEYGALIMNLRNVVTSMDRVAAQNPVVLPRYAKRDGLLRRRSGQPADAPPD